jgi:D-alanine-D-alanine ligase
MARVDFRLDARDRLHFIECNPLPGLTPGFSDYCVIADAAGIEYRSLIGEILAPAIRRLHQRRRIRLLEGRP